MWILFNFGREDELDVDAIRRVIGSLSRVLPAGAGVAAMATPEVRFLESRPAGGAWALDGLWRKVGIDAILALALRRRRFDPATEWALFTLVASRALALRSKRSCAAWASEGRPSRASRR